MRYPFANSTPARVSKPLGQKWPRALFAYATVFAATWLIVTCGCEQSSGNPGQLSTSLRTAGAMDVGQDWRRTAEVTDSRGDTFYRFDCPELNEHRWFVRRAGSLSTLPLAAEAEVPE